MLNDASTIKFNHKVQQNGLKEKNRTTTENVILDPNNLNNLKIAEKPALTSV